MNKPILVVLILMLSSFFVLAQNSKRVTIGVLDDKKTSASEQLFEQLKNDITAVVGQGTTVVFNEVLYNNHEVKTAEENYTSFLNNDTDIILAFGVVNTLMLYQKKSYSKPTVILGTINNDLIDLPKEQTTSGINNLTYLITPFSYKDDLDAFSSIYAFKKIGVVIDDFMLRLLPVKGLFDKYFQDKASSYEFIPIANGSSVDSLFNGLDAVYLVSYSNLKDTGLNEIIATVNKNKLPSLSAYGVVDVEKGILSTNQPAINIDQIFRRIALNVESINNGTNASALPLQIDYNKGLTINMTTADLIDFPIKNSMLGRTNIIEGALVNSEAGYSMSEIMRGVVNGNLSLEVSRKDVDLSEQDVKSSKSQFLPDLAANVNGTYLDPKIAELSGGQNPELTTSGNLVLQQVIYSEQAKAGIDIKNYQFAAQQEIYNSDQLDILLNASSAYFNVLILKSNVSIQNKNLQLTRQNLDIAEKNYALGASGRSDVLRFQSQVAQNTQSLIQARNALIQGHYQINQLLNQPISAKVEIRDTVITTGVVHNVNYDYLLSALDDPKTRVVLTNFLVEEAKKNAPELKNIGFNVDAVERNYRLNDVGRFVPTLALQGQYNRKFSGSGVGSDIPTSVPNGDYNVGVNLSLPIFQQYQRNINRQTTRIQREQLNVQKENVELSIEKNINDIILDLINEIANIEISAINEGFSKESLELSQNEYKNGAIPVIQLIDAQNNYLQAQLANATAQYNYALVSMQLERTLGFFFLMNTEASNQDFVQRASQYISNNN